MRKNLRRSKSKNLNEIYQDCFSFLKSSRNYLLGVVFLFILFAFIGYFTQMPSEIEAKIIETLKQITERFAGLNIYKTIWAIFSNNLSVSFFGLLFGALLGIFPILALISNGLLIGFVAKKAVLIEGIFVLWKILPHGIFELPAVLISMSLGIKLGFQIFKKDAFKNNARNSFYVFFLIVVPLLAIAAIIEGILVFLVK